VEECAKAFGLTNVSDVLVAAITRGIENVLEYPGAVIWPARSGVLYEGHDWPCACGNGHAVEGIRSARVDFSDKVLRRIPQGHLNQGAVCLVGERWCCGNRLQYLS
jgi:hypothetical protein